MGNNVIEDLKNLVEEERYEEAAALLPKVKEHDAKTVSEMLALARMIGKTGEPKKAEKLYLKAYKKRPSRLVLKDIMQMFIECQMPNEAELYYNKYIDLTPGDDITRLAAKYRIEKMRNTEAGYLVGVLKELKDIEYSEGYGYELCKQFYKMGDEDSCRKECAELIENFPDSKEAEKAKKLVAVMNGEISADEIKKKSGMPAWQTPSISATEIKTKDLPRIEYSKENEEENEAEHNIAESVQDIISQDVAAEESAVPGDNELADMLKSQVEDTEESSKEAAPAEEPEEKPADTETRLHRHYRDMAENAVPVHIYAETYTPTCVLGKEDFADTKVKNLITSGKIQIEHIFGQFFRNTNIRRQIYNSLELAIIDKGNSWIMITGEEKTGRTYFMKKFMFCMFSMGLVSTKKVAVTNASVINRLSSAEVTEKTGGSNLIIENATDLNEKGFATLKNLKLKKKEKICIALEDTDAAFAQFIKNPLPSGIGLNNRIHLPKYTTEDLLGFFYDTVSEQGYAVEKVAADLAVSCINSTRAESQGERYVHALELARKSAATADARIRPDVLKMAAEAAFQEYYSLTIIREDITP